MSDLEASFDYHWRVLDGPELTPEYRFDTEHRSRFDRAHVPAKVAIEIEGATFSGGRHTTGTGFAADCVKYNRATAQGWAVFRLTSDMLRDDPHGHLTPIIATIEARMEMYDIYGRL